MRVSTGGYFHERKLRTPSSFAVEAANVDRLWQESEKLIAAAGFPLLSRLLSVR